MQLHGRYETGAHSVLQAREEVLDKNKNVGVVKLITPNCLPIKDRYLGTRENICLIRYV